MAAKKSASKTEHTKPAKPGKRNTKAKYQVKNDNFLEQTMSTFEERARQELDDLKERLEGGFEEVSSRATRTTSKLEDAFDKRVAMAYNRLGLPSKADIDALAAKIDTLQTSLAALETGAQEKSAGKKSPRKKTTTKKSTAKKTSRKKASSKKAARKKSTPRGGKR